MIDDFYATIERFPEARRVIVGGREQIERLKTSLRAWLEALFSGRYNEPYVMARWQTGRRHVEIGLEEVYTAAAMARLRSGLTQAISHAWRGKKAELLQTLGSLNKLLEARTQLNNLISYMDGKSGAEDLIAKVLNDPALLKSLVAQKKPEGEG